MMIGFTLIMCIMNKFSALPVLLPYRYLVSFVYVQVAFTGGLDLLKGVYRPSSLSYHASRSILFPSPKKQMTPCMRLTFIS